MSKHSIQSLNYMTIGDNRMFINMDTSISYELSDNLIRLKSENDNVVMNLEDLSTGIRLTNDSDPRNTEETRHNFNMSRLTKNRIFEMEFQQINEDKNVLSSDDNVTVKPTYDIIDIAIKSSSFNPKDNFKKFDNENITHSDIYAPQMQSNPVQMCQINERTYILSKPQKRCAEYLDCQQHDKSEYYDVGLCTFNYETALYKKYEDLSGDISSLNQYFKQYNTNSDIFSQKIQDYFEPDRYLTSIEYNQIYAITHVNTKYKKNQNMNDFDNGNVYAELYTCKNAYNCNYSMEMSSDMVINGCREYVGMTENSSKLYMKYIDGISYDKDNRLPTSEYGFQKIESFTPVEIMSQQDQKHKSNLFSIRIHNSGMSDTEMKNYNDDQRKIIDNIKTDIRNAVYKIAENVSPVNTQLFDVFFEE